MDFDGNSIMAALAASAVGYVFFSYGRKMKRPPPTIGGVVLMVFPYFVTDPLMMLMTGVLIIVLVFMALRMRL